MLLVNGGVSAYHKDQGAVLRRRFAARYRGIQETGLLRLQLLCNFAAGGRGDGAAVNHGKTRAGALQDTPRPVHYFKQGIIIADIGEDHLRIARSLRRGGRFQGAKRFQLFTLGGRAVIAVYRISAFEQIDCHGHSHGAKSDEADGFHPMSPLVLILPCARKYVKVLTCNSGIE
ncbi:hypothetical protein D3C76_1048940 [compost metagenome]